MTTAESVRTVIEDPQPVKKATVLRVRVVDNSKDGRPAVNIKLPISLVKWGMKMGQAFSPELKNANIDWERVQTIIEDGTLGKIVDVEDEAQHKTVEVWVE